MNRKCPVCKQTATDLTAHHAIVHHNPNAKFVLAARASTAAAAHGEYGPRFNAWLKANARPDRV